MDDNQKNADRFLQELESRLNIDPVEVRLWLDGIKGDYEGQFLNKFVHPIISKFLRDKLPIPEDAVQAFLAESTDARKRGLASGTPASPDRHIFTKALGVPTKALVDLWWGTGEEKPFSQSCPDFAFRAPCEHLIVFEAKLFRKGGENAAKTELVKGIYQCFYYRGQPKVPGNGKKPGWNYDYACLVAYDASEGASLVKAWKAIAEKVGKDCWETSKIFVMVLPRA